MDWKPYQRKAPAGRPTEETHREAAKLAAGCVLYEELDLPPEGIRERGGYQPEELPPAPSPAKRAAMTRAFIATHGDAAESLPGVTPEEAITVAEMARTITTMGFERGLIILFRDGQMMLTREGWACGARDVRDVISMLRLETKWGHNVKHLAGYFPDNREAFHLFGHTLDNFRPPEPGQMEWDLMVFYRGQTVDHVWLFDNKLQRMVQCAVGQYTAMATMDIPSLRAAARKHLESDHPPGEAWEEDEGGGAKPGKHMVN